MRHRREVLGSLLALACSGPLAGCYPFARTHSYRFKVTVEVDTPSGLRAGSSVMESLARKQFSINGAGHAYGMSGQAVQIDLGSESLFMLVNDYQAMGGMDSLASHALIPEWVGGDGPEKYYDHLHSSAGIGRTAVLPRDQYPILVAFKDVRRPDTVMIVDPDTLSPLATHGRVRRIVLVTTREPVTKTLFKTLPWLNPPGQRGLVYAPRTSTHFTPTQRLGTYDFYSGNAR